jgi:Flp pilus assembly protein TadD
MGTRIAGTYNKGNDLRAADETPKAPSETFESQDLFRRAQVLVQKRNYERAESLLAEAIKIVPDNARYLSYYGLCIGMLGRAGEGENLCARALKLDPSSPIACVNLGRLRLMLGNRKEAHELFSRAYAMDNMQSAAALELSAMGVRRQPVIPFLSRDNPLNLLLGRFRHRILGFKQPTWKKL